MHVYLCATQSSGCWWDRAAPPCHKSHNQAGPGGLVLSWLRNTEGGSMGRKLLGWEGEADDTVCDVDSSFWSDISV